MRFDLIDDEHFSSLILPHNGILVETALSDWLGITYGNEEMPGDPINLVELETYMSDMNINDKKEQEDEVEKEEKVNDNEQEEKK
ncbi:unnamed protein product [Rotaria socialis]|uniref:Uncharacterized protein n=1 Tax=Rotaria socialis TaxID=392032 RepID=A0A821E0E3_9BILA|nr:unnamed protein product [Rotaria socialis]